MLAGRLKLLSAILSGIELLCLAEDIRRGSTLILGVEKAIDDVVGRHGFVAG